MYKNEREKTYKKHMVKGLTDPTKHRIIHPITQTVEEEEYPSQGDGTGSREQWDHGADPDGEWTSEGGGESSPLP